MVLLPDGSAPGAGSTIEAKLSQAAATLDGAESEIVTDRVYCTLDADGGIPSTFQLTPTDALDVTGLYYRFTIRAKDARGSVRDTVFKAYVPSTPDPIDIGALERIDQVAGTAVGFRLATATVPGVVQLTNDFGGTAAAPTVRAQAFTTATRPTADATWHRRLISVRDAGTDGEMHYCRQAADGSYEWIAVAPPEFVTDDLEVADHGSYDLATAKGIRWTDGVNEIKLYSKTEDGTLMLGWPGADVRLFIRSNDVNGNIKLESGEEVQTIEMSGTLGDLYQIVGSTSGLRIQAAKGVQITGLGSLSLATDGGVSQAGRLFQGPGVPSDANGTDGDAYFRTDTPGVANQRLYVRSAGAWVGIL
jgi:hypothetical protein